MSEVRKGVDTMNLELKYVKTGSVPGNEAFLFWTGNPAVIRDSVCPWWYINTGKDHILIDASFSMEDAARLGVESLCKRKVPEEEPLSALRNVGIEPEKVNHLILTHTHYDHIGYLDRFPNAKIYIHRKELAWASVPRLWYPGYGEFTTPRLNSVSNQLFPLDTTWAEIIKGVEVMCVGGHTPGCMAVFVDTAGGRVCLAGDNLFVYENIEKGLPIACYHNLDEVLSSMELFPKLADIIVPGHDAKIYERYPNGF